jgi:hypothetical protein
MFYELFKNSDISLGTLQLKNPFHFNSLGMTEVDSVCQYYQMCIPIFAGWGYFFALKVGQCGGANWPPEPGSPPGTGMVPQ